MPHGIELYEHEQIEDALWLSLEKQLRSSLLGARLLQQHRRDKRTYEVVAELERLLRIIDEVRGYGTMDGSV
jgi:hypothetical protein